MSAMKEFVEGDELDVLFLDPTYQMFPVGDSAGNLFIAGNLLRSVTELGQQTGCTIILAHHNRKNSKSVAEDSDGYLFTGRILGFYSDGPVNLEVDGKSVGPSTLESRRNPRGTRSGDQGRKRSSN